VAISYVDLGARPMAPGELRRFSQRFGPSELVDRDSRVYRASGLAYMRLSDADLFDRLLADQQLIRLPLVRSGQLLSVGHDEAAWRSWLAAPQDQ
jgi:arsenate reductase-like glutaredoxin family protein